MEMQLTMRLLETKVMAGAFCLSTLAGVGLVQKRRMATPHRRFLTYTIFSACAMDFFAQAFEDFAYFRNVSVLDLLTKPALKDATVKVRNQNPLSQHNKQNIHMH